MKYYEYMQLVISGMHDPKLLAKASSDYYDRCRQRLSDKINELYSKIENSSTQTTKSYIQIDRVNPNTLVKEPVLLEISDVANQVRNTISDFDNDIISNLSIDNTVLQVTNQYNNEQVAVSWNELATSVSASMDQLTLVTNSFNALSKEVMSSSADFVNTFLVTAPAASAEAIQAASNLYAILSDDSLSIFQKYNNINEYVGIKQNMDRTEDQEFEISNIPVEQFTGVNPTSAFISGLELANPLKFYAAIMKWQNAAVIGISKFVWKGIAKIGSWFIKSVNETFINPVDCECDGNSYEYFENYTTLRYLVENLGEIMNPYAWDKNMLSFFNKDGTISPVFSVSLTHAYQATYDPTNKELLVNRYIKPISHTGLRSILDQSTVNGVINPVDFFSKLQDNKEALTVKKDATEQDVAKGLLCSIALESAVTRIISYNQQSLAIDLDNRESKFVNNFKTIMLNDIDVSSDDNVTQLSILVDALIENNTNQSNIESLIWSYSHSDEMKTVINHVLTNQITNKDFLSIVASNKPSYTSEVLTPFNAPSDFNICYVNITPAYNANPIACDLFTCELLMSILCTGPSYVNTDGWSATANKIDLSSYLDGVYLAYSRKERNFIINSRIKTDEENRASVEKWISTAIIIAAVITVAVVIGVGVVKLTKASTLSSAKLASQTRQLGELVNDPTVSQDTINDAYKQLKKTRFTNNLLDSLTGSANKSSTSIISNISDTLLQRDQIGDSGIDDVIKLIK